jgi:hypothetical protein
VRGAEAADDKSAEHGEDAELVRELEAAAAAGGAERAEDDVSVCSEQRPAVLGRPQRQAGARAIAAAGAAGCLDGEGGGTVGQCCHREQAWLPAVRPP